MFLAKPFLIVRGDAYKNTSLLLASFSFYLNYYILSVSSLIEILCKLSLIPDLPFLL